VAFRAADLAWRYQFIEFCVVPVVALLGWLLVPYEPLGLAGWRWVALIGSAGALAAWWLRHALPESPRWLSLHAQAEGAEKIMQDIEARVARETGRRRAPARAREHRPGVGQEPLYRAVEAALRQTHRRLSVFNLMQTIAFYSFGSWVPKVASAPRYQVC